MPAARPAVLILLGRTPAFLSEKPEQRKARRSRLPHQDDEWSRACCGSRHGPGYTVIDWVRATAASSSPRRKIRRGGSGIELDPGW